MQTLDKNELNSSELKELQNDNTSKLKKDTKDEEKKSSKTEDQKQIEDMEKVKETPDIKHVNESTDEEGQFLGNGEDQKKGMQIMDGNEPNISELKDSQEVQHDSTSKLTEKIPKKLKKRPNETEDPKQIGGMEKVKGTPDIKQVNDSTNAEGQFLGNGEDQEKGMQITNGNERNISELKESQEVQHDSTSKLTKDTENEVKKPNDTEDPRQIEDLDQNKGTSDDTSVTDRIKAEYNVGWKLMEEEQEKLRRSMKQQIDIHRNSDTQMFAHAPQEEAGKPDSDFTDLQSPTERKVVTDSLQQKRLDYSADYASKTSTGTSEAIPKQFKIIMSSSIV